MRLVRFTSGSKVGWGFVDPDDSDYVRMVGPDSPSLTEALGIGIVALEKLLSSAGDPTPISNVQLHAPIEQPSKVICIGLNYADHARESGMPLPEQPLVFAKFPSSIVGPYDEIQLPPESTKIDWEAELAVVIGRKALQVSPAHALEHVGGFMVANDVSARDIQASDGQWVRAKSFTSFCPLGPWLTTPDEVGDHANLAIRLMVNGVLKQDGNTFDMIADVSQIVSFCSTISALEVGDIILTGTPAGIGAGMNPQQFLQEGDLVETTIAGLGSLMNRVVRTPQ